MQLIFLGSGGFHPSERRHTACLMIPEAGIVFDAGTAAFRVPPRLQTDELTIFLSHAHLDHILGLTYLLVPVLEGRIKRVRVFATKSVIRAVKSHLFSKPIFPKLPAEFEFLDIKAVESVQFECGITVTHHLLKSHPSQSRAYRVRWDNGRQAHEFAYVTDTTVDGTYSKFIRDVPLLIHECYFPDCDESIAHETGHSSTSMVAHLALEVGAQRLILCHVDPRTVCDDPIGLDTARAIFPATEIADDLLEVDLSTLKSGTH